MKIGHDFGHAVCRHFGLPASQVLEGLKVNTGCDEVFSVTLTIALTPEDLEGIAQKMSEQIEKPLSLRLLEEGMAADR